MRSRVQVSLSLQGKRQNIRHLRYVVSAFLLRKCSICYKFFKTIRSDKTNATPRPLNRHREELHLMASLIPLRLVVTIETIVTAEMAANNNWPRCLIGLMDLIAPNDLKRRQIQKHHKNRTDDLESHLLYN